MTKCLSPYEKIQELQVSENFQMEINQIREGKNQADTDADNIDGTMLEENLC